MTHQNQVAPADLELGLEKSPSRLRRKFLARLLYCDILMRWLFPVAFVIFNIVMWH